MIVNLVLFAGVRDVVGSGKLELTLGEGATVDELKSNLASLYPDAANIIDRSAISVNHSYAVGDCVIPDGAEVGVIPPVSGG